MHSEHLQFFLRWLHILFGIAWIGHLYFFNFVNANFAKTLDAATKPKVVPELMPRALWWFRWGAMITFLAGIAIVVLKYFVGEGAPGFKSMDGTRGLMVEDRGLLITWGGLLGTIMWFNVWFVIWPRQQKIITCVKKGQKPPEMDHWVKVAGLASKANTYLSGPMLLFMAAGSHAGDFGITHDLKWLGIILVAGFVLIHLLFQMAPKIVPWKMD